MTRNRAVAFLSALVLVILGLNCECDEGPGLETAAPRIDQIAVGDAETPGPDDEFVETPASGEISIDFGLVDVDTVRQHYLFLHNGGKSALKLSKVEMAEGSSSEFTVTCQSGGVFVDCPSSAEEMISVEAGQNMVIQISYTPVDVGTDSGSFTVETNASDHETLTVYLDGEGVTPEVRVCITDCEGDEEGADCAAASQICNEEVAPEDLEMPFGEVDMETSLRRKVTIENLGDRPLQVTPHFGTGAFNQFQLDLNENDLPGELPVGEQAEIYVEYDPGMGGEHECSLQIDTNDVNERNIKIVLTGRALAPRVCPQPLFLDFGNVASGESLPKTFSITNCGLLDLNLIDVAMNDDTSPDFSISEKPAMPLDLPPGDSVDIEVTYAPPADGTDHGGVDIFSNDPASDPDSHFTGTVDLHGRSIPRACDIQATPFQVTFGGVVVGGSQQVELIISNQGTDTCILNDVAITSNSTDDEFSILEKPPANTNFDPGDTLLVKLSYDPVNLGVDTGTLTMYGNDKDASELPVDLNGQGVDAAVCDLDVRPTNGTMGLVKVNNSKAISFILENRGMEECNISSLELKQSMMQPGDLTITSGPSAPFVINRSGQPNSQVEIEVTFAPDNPGEHWSYLWLTSNDPDLQLGNPFMGCIPQPTPGQACVPVKGSADEGTIAAVPAELDFGVVTVGCASPELRITVYNLGGIALSISSIYLEDPGGPFQIRSAPATPYNLAGGANVEIRLRYVPGAVDTDRSTLYIESDASNTQLLAIPLFGRGTNISDQTDIFHQPNQVRSDVLFAVDNSGSMSEEQASLASNFDAFINHAITLDVDFQIGVIATEVNDPETDQGDPDRDIFPGVLVQAPGRPKIITNSTPNLTDAFTDNVTVGTCCSDEQEAGLEAAWMALSPGYIDDPSKNGGFLREDAKLYIICVSDEQDQSAGEPDFYVDFFSSIKGYRNTERMAVSAIVGDSPDGCGNGQAGSGSRYIEVANQTGGLFVSICTSNWAQALQSLGLDAFAAIREFPLSRPADSNSITVTVEGSPVPQASCNDCDACDDGWVYYPDTNSICFGANYVPEMGDRIEVSYTAECITP